MSFKTRAGFVNEGTYTPDSLFAGDFPVRTREVALTAGENLKRGALLGIVTADGKAKLSAAASSDGSQVPNCILAEDISAIVDTQVVVYISGDFNDAALTYGAGHSVTSVYAGLRDLNIYLHLPVGA
jgi:hypothetical protein